MYASLGATIAEQCQTPPLAEAEYVLRNISNERRAEWIAFVRTIDATGIWERAIAGNDAATLAFEVCGGDDRRLTSPGGKALGARFWDEFVALSSEPDYTMPGIDVTVPRGGISRTGLYAAAALGLLLLAAPKGR